MSSVPARTPSGPAPVDKPVARAAAITTARLAREHGASREELLDLLGALGIAELARPPRRTRKARR